MHKEERTDDYKGRYCYCLWNSGHIPLGGVSGVGVGLESVSFEARGGNFEDSHLSLSAHSISSHGSTQIWKSHKSIRSWSVRASSKTRSNALGSRSSQHSAGPPG